ncbi:hypothetical protein LZ32DRAFT_166107 [Colletotrichum eremochloae]|nr:hypothetical protein LZ32DRAFT_166107 [Colletotrichum eremochloae]
MRAHIWQLIVAVETKKRSTRVQRRSTFEAPRTLPMKGENVCSLHSIICLRHHKLDVPIPTLPKKKTPNSFAHT